MKKALVLLIVSVVALTPAIAHQRFQEVRGSSHATVTRHQPRETAAQLRERMRSPEVQKVLQRLQAFLVSRKGTKSTSERTYVGSEYCLACHTSYKTWRNTNHARSLRAPKVENSMIEGVGVIADYDQNGVDDFVQGLNFNDISSPYDPYKPNAPILSVKDGVYTITIGDVDMPVVFVSGGMQQWRERYQVRIPASDSPTGYTRDIYFSIMQYNLVPKAWQPYKAQLWYGPDHQPKIHSGMTLAELVPILKPTFSKNCLGCHTTGIRHIGKWDDGEWQFQPQVASLYAADDPNYFDYDGDGFKDMVNVGCEACHGPGSAHILGGGDPDKIVNPDDLEPAQGNEVCGRCHNRVRSVPNKTFGWPYHDDADQEWNVSLGEPLADYFVSNNEFWPDGISSYEHNQHYSELNRSAHMTNPYHKVRCFDCHDPHGRDQDFQIRTSLVEDDLTIATSDKDNTLCLACHATHGPFESITPEMVQNYEENLPEIGKVVSAHSHHPYGADRSMGLSRCTLCHMTAVANTNIESVLRDHSFEVLPPEKTLAYQEEGGMPNTCADSCHNTRVNLWNYGLDPSELIWNDPFDVTNATKLQEYFGPAGKWWDTSSQKKR